MIPSTRIEDSFALLLIKDQTYIDPETHRQSITPLGRTVLESALKNVKEELNLVTTKTAPWEWLGRYDIVLRECQYNLRVLERIKMVFEPREMRYDNEDIKKTYAKKQWQKDDVAILVNAAYHKNGTHFTNEQLERIRREARAYPELGFETSVLFLEDIISKETSDDGRTLEKLLGSALSLLAIAAQEDPEDYTGGQFALSLIANIIEKKEISALFQKFVPQSRAGYFPTVECGDKFAFKIVSTDEALRMEWVASIKELPRTTLARVARRWIDYTPASSFETFKEIAEKIELIRNHEGTADCHYGFKLAPPINTFPIDRKRVLVAMKMDGENLDSWYKTSPPREEFYEVTGHVLTELTRFHVTLTEHVDYKDGRFIYALERSWPIEPSSHLYQDERRSVPDNATQRINTFFSKWNSTSHQGALEDMATGRSLWFPEEKTDTYAIGAIPVLDYEARLFHRIVGNHGDRVGKNKKLSAFIKNLTPLLEFIKSGPLTVCMGDCYDTNILKSGTLCDLELVMANPFYDFANFIGEPSKDAGDKAAFVAQIIDEYQWSYSLHVIYDGRIIKDPSVLIDLHERERRDWIVGLNLRRKGKHEYVNPAEQANFERFSAALCAYSPIRCTIYDDDTLFGFFKACEIINSMGEFGANFNRAFSLSATDEKDEEGKRKAIYHLQNSLRLTRRHIPSLYRAWKSYLKASGNTFIKRGMEATDYKKQDPITAASVGEWMKYHCDQYKFGINRIKEKTLSERITEQKQPSANH